MAQAGGGRENQHYVPKVLLRNFAIDQGVRRGSEQVHVFDKSNGNAFVSNIRNVAAAFEFYDVGEGSVESSLSELEARAAQALQNILAAPSLTTLSNLDRTWFAIFCAVQFMRTQSVRDRVRRINSELEEHIKKLGFDPAKVEGFQRMSDEDIKAMTVHTLLKSLSTYPALFYEKAWFLLEAPGQAVFMIGDHPIALHNDRKLGVYGTLGLAVPGIQIYLPLTSRLTLAMWDEGVVKDIEKETAEPRLLRDQIKALKPPPDKVELVRQHLDELESNLAPLDAMLTAARTGQRVVAPPQIIEMLNALQVRYSSRFVMSSKKDFAEVEKMLAEEASLRTTEGDGLRFD
jgi:hypothetical protein